MIFSDTFQKMIVLCFFVIQNTTPSDEPEMWKLVIHTSLFGKHFSACQRYTVFANLVDLYFSENMGPDPTNSVELTLIATAGQIQESHLMYIFMLGLFEVNNIHLH